MKPHSSRHEIFAGFKFLTFWNFSAYLWRVTPAKQQQQQGLTAKNIVSSGFSFSSAG